MGSISHIANLWFGEHEQARSMAISGMMIPLGSILGFAMTGILARDIESYE